MTVEFGTMGHGASVLSMSFDRALETLALGDRGSIYLIACRKDIRFDLFAQFIFFGILEFEFPYISLARNAGFIKMSFHGFRCAVSVDHFFFAALILIDDSVLLIDKTYLNCLVTVVFYCFHLCYIARPCLKYRYRNQRTVFIEDLGHSDLCC